LETFTETKALVENPHYHDQRRECLAGLDDSMIDKPIIGLVNAFNKPSFCFTLQSCYGHFVHRGQPDPHGVAPLSIMDTVASVEYRIAYIAFCIENNDAGMKLLNALREITEIDPANIQFGCAEWFWDRQLNSYALQVEPDRFKYKDTAILNGQEALKIERVRNKFFIQLEKLLQTT
jgi:hypothetical protein